MGVFFLIFFSVISAIPLIYKKDSGIIDCVYAIKLESKTPDGSGVSNIIMSNMEFQTPNTIYKVAGTYFIQTKEWGRGYLFDHWAFSGDIDVADPLNLVTNMTLKGEGILKAIFVPIKVQVNVSSHYRIIEVGENCTIRVSVNSDTNQTYVYIRPVIIAPNGIEVSTFPLTPLLIQGGSITFHWPENGVRGWDWGAAATSPGPYSLIIHVSAGDDDYKPNFGSIVVKPFLLEFMVDIGKSNLDLRGADCSFERGYYIKRVEILWDRVEVYDKGTSPIKVKIGKLSTVWFKARYGYYSVYFDNSSGQLYVNGSACIWSPTRYRWELNISRYEPDALNFKVSNIVHTKNGLNMWNDNVGSIRIEWLTEEYSLPQHAQKADLKRVGLKR